MLCLICIIWGLQGSKNQDYSLWECNAVLFGRFLPVLGGTCCLLHFSALKVEA